MVDGGMVEKVFRSFAKVNLFLKILGERSDGYTEIRTIFQTISLHDTLSFVPILENDIKLEICGEVKIPVGKENLIYKTAFLLKERFSVNKGIKIKLEKRIPTGAGLGGGSSNSAITLLALNDLWGLNLSMEELCEIGSELGSDVPFFLRGGSAFGFGRGNELIFFPDGYFKIPQGELLLVVPDFKISTSWAYETYRRFLLTKEVDKNKITCLYGGEVFFENDFEKLLFKEYPVLLKLKNLLLNYGAKVCIISGSGSVLFGVFHHLDSDTKELIVAELPAKFRVLEAKFLSAKEYGNLIYKT